MFNYFFLQLSIGERIKLLRSVYNLSLEAVGRYCTDYLHSKITKASVSTWENNKKIPSCESLFLISNLFGISSDWLIGRSNEIYSNGVLTVLESSFRNNLFVTVQDKYFEIPFTNEQRELLEHHFNHVDESSLVLRANIIFMLRIISYEWERIVKNNLVALLSEEEVTLKNRLYNLYVFLVINTPHEPMLKSTMLDLEKVLTTKQPLYIIPQNSSN